MTCEFAKIKEFLSQQEQSSPKVWDKISIVWNIIELGKYRLERHVNLTKFDHHEKFIVGDTKNTGLKVY